MQGDCLCYGAQTRTHSPLFVEQEIEIMRFGPAVLHILRKIVSSPSCHGNLLFMIRRLMALVTKLTSVSFYQAVKTASIRYTDM